MTPTNDRLQAFYLGTLTEADRLEVERDLLVDSELLLDFFELKRESENVRPVPSGPSPQLWQKLVRTRPSRRQALWLSAAAGAAAATLALFWSLQQNAAVENLPAPLQTKVIFDSSAELPVTSNVL